MIHLKSLYEDAPVGARVAVPAPLWMNSGMEFEFPG
jgi:hypothetical protein